MQCDMRNGAMFDLIECHAWVVLPMLRDGRRDGRKEIPAQLVL